MPRSPAYWNIWLPSRPCLPRWLNPIVMLNVSSSSIQSPLVGGVRLIFVFGSYVLYLRCDNPLVPRVLHDIYRVCNTYHSP